MTGFLTSILKKERFVYRFGRYYIKIYTDYQAAYSEYMILRKIHKYNPGVLVVPKPLLFFNMGDLYLFVIREIEGQDFRNVIYQYLKGDKSFIRYIILLSEALRAMHQIFSQRRLLSDVKPCNIAKTSLEVYEDSIRILDEIFDIMKHSKLLRFIFLKDKKIWKKLYIIMKELRMEYEPILFTESLVHSELYFTHVYYQDNYHVAFIDFGFACRGPIYVDLAVFPLSIFLSLAFAPYTIYLKNQIRRIFLYSYFGKAYKKEIDLALRRIELYVLLRIIRDILRSYKESMENKNLLAKVVFIVKLCYTLHFMKKYLELSEFLIK